MRVERSQRTAATTGGLAAHERRASPPGPGDRRSARPYAEVGGPAAEDAGAAGPGTPGEVADTACSRRRLVSIAGVAALAGLVGGCARPGQSFAGARLTVDKARLYWGGQPFTALGANVWQLQDYFYSGARSFTIGGTTWNGSYPGGASHGAHVLQEASAYGLHVIRFIAGGWNPAWVHVWQTNAGTWWRAHDAMMAAAAKAGVYLIPSLLFHPGAYAVATGESHASVFQRGTRANRLAMEFVRQYVSRYKGHPNVLLWELGNEWNLGTARGPVAKQYFHSLAQLQQAMADVTAAIRDIDPHHLVGSGNASPPNGNGPVEGSTLSEQRRAFIAVNQHVDVACLHVYANAGLLAPTRVAAYLRTMAAAARSDLGKPLMVGEFGEDYVTHPQATFVRNILGSWSSGTFPLALVWSWMAAPATSASQRASSVDPTVRPRIAALFRSYASRHPWPPRG